jgi:hypothetical protein
MTPDERHAWAEDHPTVRMLRELAARGWAEIEERRRLDPHYR